MKYLLSSRGRGRGRPKLWRVVQTYQNDGRDRLDTQSVVATRALRVFVDKEYKGEVRV